jgi:hypothetical protein
MQWDSDLDGNGDGSAAIEIADSEVLSATCSTCAPEMVSATVVMQGLTGLALFSDVDPCAFGAGSSCAAREAVKGCVALTSVLRSSS